MKTIAGIIREVRQTRDRQRMEQIQAIMPYLQQMYASAVQKEQLAEQRAYQQQQHADARLENKQDLDEQRIYNEKIYQQRRTERFEDYKKQHDYQIEKQKEIMEHKDSLKDSTGSGTQQSQGLGYFDGMTPEKYKKDARDKIIFENIKGKDRAFVYVKKDGKIIKQEIQQQNGVYTWNNGQPIDLSKVISTKDVQEGDAETRIVDTKTITKPAPKTVTAEEQALTQKQPAKTPEVKKPEVKKEDTKKVDPAKQAGTKQPQPQKETKKKKNESIALNPKTADKYLKYKRN